jgi:hypothetical protein
MTRTGITAEMVGVLAAPTPPDEKRQRQGNRQHDGDCNKRGGVCQLPHRMLDYVDARFVMDRLDEIGAENWQDQFVDRADGAVRCGIGVLIDGEWVWKWDVGTASDIEPEKGSYSEAFKRAGVKWGIARDLYGHATTHAAPGAPSRPAAPPRPTPTPPPASGGNLQEPEYLREAFHEPEERPVAAAPGGECPMHHLAWTLKPGGHSKTTGKPYDAFWACPSNERPFCKEKPSKAWTARQEVAS